MSLLITFRSKAAGDVIMYKEHAKPILDLLGKDVDQGIITPEQSAAAVARLEAEIEAVKQAEAQQQTAAADEDEEDEEERRRARQKVSFSTRVYPLLEMLRAAQRRQQPVTWGA